MTSRGDRLVVAAFKGAERLANALPPRVSAAGAHVLGVLASGAARERRAMVRRHVQRVHGGRLRRAQVEWHVQRVFDSYAEYWQESFRMAEMSADDLAQGMTVEGDEPLRAALATGKGAILAIPHLGGWDFGGAYLSAVAGFTVTVVVEALDPPELLEWFTDRRECWGVEIVPLGPDAGAACLRALNDGGLLCLFADRDVAGGGIEVDFFGERTTLPGGPATLALRAGVPIFPAAVYYGGPRGHRGVILPALDTERTGRLRADVTRVTQDVAHALETLIREAPDQWHLLQPNWPSDHA